MEVHLTSRATSGLVNHRFPFKKNCVLNMYLKENVIYFLIFLFVQTIINGCGEEQQLYCPGTIDHSHKLTFQLESDMPLSNPSVPLSYTMIDQRKFFKREAKDMDVDKILESIHDPPKQTWPFVGKEYADIIWSAGSQPDTNIQVRLFII